MNLNFVWSFVQAGDCVSSLHGVSAEGHRIVTIIGVIFPGGKLIFSASPRGRRWVLENSCALVKLTAPTHATARFMYGFIFHCP
jgi:hypothetical protein